MFVFLKTFGSKQPSLSLLNVSIFLLVILFSYTILSSSTMAQTIEWTSVSEQYDVPEGVEIYRGTRNS
ncbi:MAG: hypothetical protein EBR32_02205, partial [Bacteroidetes bacterium]|nr:hypothetical protein [Bacteroidota bacterium]